MSNIFEDAFSAMKDVVYKTTDGIKEAIDKTVETAEEAAKEVGKDLNPAQPPIKK